MKKNTGKSRQDGVGASGSGNVGDRVTRRDGGWGVGRRDVGRARPRAAVSMVLGVPVEAMGQRAASAVGVTAVVEATAPSTSWTAAT